MTGAVANGTGRMFIRTHVGGCVAATSERDQRLNAHLTEQEDRLLREAAAELGKPVSRFVIESGVEQAGKILYLVR